MERLETVLIDIPNKVFEINGKSLPKECFKLSITFENGVWEVNFTSEFNFVGEALRD